MVKLRPGKISISRTVAALLVLIAVGLIGARLYLHVWATQYVNRQIAALHGYQGWVQDVGISLWRGAYQIYDMRIFKSENGLEEPFVAARTVDLSVEWRALLHGRIVAKIVIDNIDLNFAVNQTGRGGGWKRFVDALSPLDINRLEVRGGRVAYIDAQAKPRADIHIDDLAAEITNLRNVERRTTTLPSDVRVSGVSLGKGKFQLKGRANILLRDVPDFDIDIKLENAALPAFNDYARAVAAVDFEKGRASVYCELAASNGEVDGYLKFLASDVSVGSRDSPDHNPLSAVWKMLVAAFMEIFKNHPRDQFALRIPVRGNIHHPGEDGWSAFFSIFENAFGRAFTRNVDGSVTFSDAVKAAQKD
jgi:hypothetical protein